MFIKCFYPKIRVGTILAHFSAAFLAYKFYFFFVKSLSVWEKFTATTWIFNEFNN